MLHQQMYDVLMQSKELVLAQMGNSTLEDNCNAGCCSLQFQFRHSETQQDKLHSLKDFDLQ
jgi:hypothetical protein